MSTRPRFTTLGSVLRNIFAAAILSILTPAILFGHDFRLTDVEVRLSERSFRIDMVCDLDALALGVPQDEDSSRLAQLLGAMPPERLEETVEKLRRFFQRRIRVRFDGKPVSFEVEFAGPSRSEPDSEPTVLGTMATFSGDIPQDARAFSLFASRSFPPLHISFVTDRGEPLLVQLPERGARSAPLLIHELRAPPRHQVFLDYARLGFRHILPSGADHVLFVLGLFLLAARLKPLMLQITAFTAAHTVTLALSSFGLVTLSPSVVEPLIALSIAWVAVENLLTSEVGKRRIALVFAFGMLHGLGFAGVLGELGLPKQRFLSALLSFNAGVELGQISVVLIAFLAVGWFRGRDWYRARIVLPGSVLVGCVGFFWFVERLL